MSLKTLRAQIQQTADEIRADTVDRVTLIIVDRVDGSLDAEPMEPPAGYICDYFLAGKRRRLFFPGQDPEQIANALFDHVHRFERVAGIRPMPVLMSAEDAPDDALTIEQPPEGITPVEHVARLYDALRAAA